MNSPYFLNNLFLYLKFNIIKIASSGKSLYNRLAIKHILRLHNILYIMNKSNKKVGTDDIVKEGEAILKKCREYMKDRHLDTYMKDNNIKNVKKMGKDDYNKMYSNISEKDYESLHKKIVEEHKQFASVYAIVVRSIVYSNEFYSEALRRYVNHLTNNPWNTKKEFVERQAEFLVYSFREKYPRCGTSQLAEYKQRVLKGLLEEDKKFDEMAKETTEIVNKEWEGIIDDRRERLHQLLTQMKKKEEQEEKLKSGVLV